LAERRSRAYRDRSRTVRGLLTKTPDEVGPADVDAARDAGVTEAALAEAVYVAFFFNLINRVADALEFTQIEA
jgi:alkylhydroperoxidase family enzyme